MISNKGKGLILCLNGNVLTVTENFIVLIPRAGKKPLNAVTVGRRSKTHSMNRSRNKENPTRAAAPIMPGAEPFFYKAGEQGCLLIHGISGTPQVFRAMGEKLAADGISALGVRLKGHGTLVEEMHSCRYEDWVQSGQEALFELEKHCSRIFCVGLSMGGVIALRLAKLFPQQVKGVVTICSPYKLRELKYKAIPLAKYMLKKIATGPKSINDPSAVEINYPYHSLPAVHQLIKLTAVVRADLPQIRQPALIFGARADWVVDRRDPGLIYEQIGSDKKDLVWLERSQHVAPLDYDKEIILEKLVSFIRSNS
jgi:carboxylesterase